MRDVELALARGMKGNPRIVSLQPDSLEQIWEDVRRVARALDIPERGDQVVHGLQARMNAADRGRLRNPPRAWPASSGSSR